MSGEPSWWCSTCEPLQRAGDEFSGAFQNRRSIAFCGRWRLLAAWNANVCFWRLLHSLQCRHGREANQQIVCRSVFGLGRLSGICSVVALEHEPVYLRPRAVLGVAGSSRYGWRWRDRLATGIDHAPAHNRRYCWSGCVCHNDCTRRDLCSALAGLHSRGTTSSSIDWRASRPPITIATGLKIKVPLPP